MTTSSPLVEVLVYWFQHSVEFAAFGILAAGVMAIGCICRNGKED